MKKHVLTVSLNPCLDAVLRVDMTMSRSVDPVFTAGGKGINVARALKSLGVTSLATGIIGGDVGRRIEMKLAKEHIADDLLKVAKESRVNWTVYDGNADHPARILGKGPKLSRDISQKFLYKFRQHAKRSQLVVMAGRNANGLPDSFYAQLIKEARKAGVLTALDTSADALRLAVKAKPFILKMNREEASILLGRELDSFSALVRGLRSLAQMNAADMILITLAEKGALGSYQNRLYYIRAPKINVINTVGCGDAFLAGFIYALLRSASFEDCLKTAVAAGSASAQQTIPGLINRDIFRKMLYRVSKEFY